MEPYIVPDLGDIEDLLDRGGATDEHIKALNEIEERWQKCHFLSAMETAIPGREQVLMWLWHPLSRLSLSARAQRACWFHVVDLFDAFASHASHDDHVDEITCWALLQIALKLFDFRGSIKLQELLKQSGYEVVQVNFCEVQVLRCLGWHLTAPTVEKWLNIFCERAIAVGLSPSMAEAFYSNALHQASAVLGSGRSPGPSLSLARGCWFLAALAGVGEREAESSRNSMATIACAAGCNLAVLRESAQLVSFGDQQSDIQSAVQHQ